MPSNSLDKSVKSPSMLDSKGEKVRVETCSFEDRQAKRRRLNAKRYKALFVEQKRKPDAHEPSEEPKMLEKILQSDCRTIDSRKAEDKHHSVDNQSESKSQKKSENSVDDPDLFNGITPEVQPKKVIVMDKDKPSERNVDCEFPDSKCKDNSVELDSSRRLSSEVQFEYVSSAPHKEGPSEYDSEIHASVLKDIPPLSSHDKRGLTSHVESDRIEENLESQVKLMAADTISKQNSLCVDIGVDDDEENVHFKEAEDLEHCDAARDSTQALNEAHELSGRCSSSPRRHRFAEYWVPARISNLQLEQYCSALLSNSMSLRSSSKSDPVGALRNLLVTLRQTCSHPFLVDRNLSSSLLKDVKETEYLDIGIKASGKLQLLDTMLLEMRKRGMRVLILYESIDGRDGIGDILDDFLRQRYGQDSYERVDGGGFIPSKKQAALNKFNDKESGRFVFLLETHACLSSIKLSSVDAIIIHNSEWNPVNDIRALQRIVIDSQHDPIKVFRLFLPQTVEENAMILAKHKVAIDNSMHTINQSNRDKLLVRGAADLFDELERFHLVAGPISTIISCLESSLLQDVVQELLTKFLQDERNMGDGLSICLKVQRSCGDHGKYHLVSDELKTSLSEEKWPRDFWSKLLEGRNPRWKYVSSSSQRNRKRVRYDKSGEVRSNKSEGVAKRRRKIVNDNTDMTSAVENQEVVASDKGSDCDEHLPLSSYLSGRTTIAKDIRSPFDMLNCTGVESGNMLEGSKKVLDTQKGLLLMLKPELRKLCELLNMSEDVKNIAEQFLEYVMENHYVSREPVTVLHAFQLSVCWIAASLRKQQINGNESLALAKQHLNFCCSEDDTDYVYLKMGLFKELFMQSITNDKARVFDPKKLMVKIIKQIKKKCRQRSEILIQKQLKEIEELQKSSDEEKAQLEQWYKVEVAVLRSIHVHNPSIAADRLKVLEDQYSKKLEEHRNNLHIRLRSLEDMHSSERDEENELTSCWKEDIVKEQLEILRKLPHSDSENSRRKCNSNDKLMVRDGQENGCLLENQEILKTQPDVLAGRDGVCQSRIPDGSSTLPTAVPEAINNSNVVDDVVSTSAKVQLEHSASLIAVGGQLASQVANSVDLTPDREVPGSSSVNYLPLHLSTSALTDKVSGGKTSAFPIGSQQVSRSTDLHSSSGLSSTPAIDIPQSHSSDSAVDTRHETEAQSIDPIVPLPPSPSAPHKEVDNSSPVGFPSVQADNGLPPSQLNKEVEAPATEGQPELPHSTITPSSEQSDSDLQLDQPFLHTATDYSHGEPSAAEQLHQLPHSPLVASSSSQPNSSRPSLVVQPSQGISSASNADPPNLPGPRVTHAMSEFANSLFPDASFASTLSMRVPFMYLDPLQGVLEEIQKEADQSIKMYEELKQQLNSECENEIKEMVTQIRKKYETKNFELDAAFTYKKKELDSYHHKVYMNKKLATAFRNKCMELKVSAPPGMSQDNMQRQMPRPSLESAYRMVLGASSAVQTSGTLPATHSLIQPGGSTGPALTSRNLRPNGPTAASTENLLRPGYPTAPSRFSAVQTSAATIEAPMSRPVQVVNNPSALFSSNSSRPVCTTSAAPPTLNLHSSSGIRAPPPHLRFRASQPMTPNTTISACPSSLSQYSIVSLTTPSATDASFSAQQIEKEAQKDMPVTNPPCQFTSVSSTMELVCLSDDD